ncbi:MAG: TetR/AcrR family transcriptional regulator [Spirochaetales bacterium]|nr:TetR/AcrR family transcriptional regulator [Spirochaetales bacterium]
MRLTERQTTILEATLRVVARDGLNGFTMKKVAAEVGVTDAALYKHFREKTDIFEALASLFRERTLDALREIASRPGLSALKKLEAFVMDRARQFQTQPGLTVILFSEELFRGEPTIAALNFETMESHAQLLRTLVAEGQAEGSIRPDLNPYHVVLLLTGPVRMLVENWRSQPEEVLVDRIGHFWNTFASLMHP